MKKLTKVLRITIAIILLLAVVLLDTVDYTPYHDTDYYSNTIARVKQLAPSSKIKGELMVGWSKLSIIPPFPVRSVGYNKNDFYTAIHDPLYTRVMVFADDKKTIGLVSLDLIMVHPEIVKAVKLGLDSIGVDDVYFAATHTHNGYGGWSPGIASKFILGGYEKNIVDGIGKQTLKALKKANIQREPARIGYQKIALPQLVANRLDEESGSTDSLFRVIEILTASNKRALISTFSAHPTSLPRQLLELSGDYPGAYNWNLESTDDIEFSMFCAGAVGSHKPIMPDYTYEHMANYAKNISDTVASRIRGFKPIEVSDFDYTEFKVDVRESTFKISEQVKLRSWMFNSVMGDIEPKITYFQLGDLVFVGAPADFSGQLTSTIQDRVLEEGLEVIVTSFNGAYMGYITQDDYYQRKHFETQEMNWFGPYNGSYFSELMARTINQKNPVD